MLGHDYPISEPVFVKKGLSISLLALLWTLIPSIISVAMLYAVTAQVGHAFNDPYLVLSVIVLALCGLIMQPARNLSTQILSDKLTLAIDIAWRWLSVVFVLLLIGFLTKLAVDFPRRILLTWAVATPFAILGVSVVMQAWLRSVMLDVTNSRRAVFAGCNETSLSLAERIRSNPQLCMSAEGFFDDRSLERLGNPADTMIHGGLKDLAPYVKEHAIDVIFVALPIRHLPRVLELLEDLRDTTASIYYVPDIFMFDLIQARTGEIMGIPVVAMCETPFYGSRGTSKRLFDIGISLTALIGLLPLLILIALAVRWSSAGPIIFRQRRYGLDGQQIVVYKFRTMTVTEDGSVIRQATKDDERTTAVGRFLRRHSLDELPQLVNVLQGRMSLVGPRPHAVAHNEMYRKLIRGYMVRHKVRPGITGLAQVNGHRGETRSIEDMEARVHYDLEYLRKWSIFLDLRIIFKTAIGMIKDNTAY